MAQRPWEIDQASMPGREVIIFSIFPVAVQTAKRPLYSPQNEWVLKPAANGEIIRLTIRDAYEPIHGLGGRTSSYSRIPATVLAEDLLREWTTGWKFTDNMDPAGKPGIWICEEQDKLDDAKIKSSLIFKDIVKRQEILARAAIQEAGVFWRNPADQKYVVHAHHQLAKWLNVTGQDWQVKDEHDARRGCPFCGALIPNAVPVCQQCQHVVDPQMYAKLIQPHIASGVPVQAGRQQPSR